MGTTKVRIFRKRNYLVPSNFSLTRETETKKSEQCCKNSILDLGNTNVSKLPSDKCLFFFSLLFKNRNFEKLLTFFDSVSRELKIWGNERIYFLENPGPKSFLSLIYIFFLALRGKKRRRHYLRMIIINHNSIIENFEHFFSGLIRSTQTHFFLKWFLNIFMNYIQFKRAL